MTRRKAAITAWSSFGLGCVMLVAAIWLSVAANPYRPADSRVRTLDVIWALSILSIPLAGPFLASRQPSNPIGWLLCTLGLGLTVGLAGSEYALIGFGGQSDLAVAASTLAVAGLFQPARRRIQGFIDHYFYRRKYDAQRIIDDFSYKLRDEIDLKSLNTELVDVVSRTMQPTHVSVWWPARNAQS